MIFDELNSVFYPMTIGIIVASGRFSLFYFLLVALMLIVHFYFVERIVKERIKEYTEQEMMLRDL